jgi:hypothetical protein
MTLREAAGHAKEMCEQTNEEDYWIDIQGWVFNVFKGDLIGNDPDMTYVTAYEASDNPAKVYGDELETFKFRDSVNAVAVFTLSISVHLFVNSGKTVAEANAELEGLCNQRRLDWIMDNLSVSEPDLELTAIDFEEV